MTAAAKASGGRPKSARKNALQMVDGTWLMVEEEGGAR
jgi:hypothetical protein